LNLHYVQARSMEKQSAKEILNLVHNEANEQTMYGSAQQYV